MNAKDQAATLRSPRGREGLRLSRQHKRIIAVSGGKGGVGKSSFSVNLAALHAARGDRTALFDGDLGMADLNLLLGVAPSSSVLDVLHGQSLEEALVEAHGIHLLPGLNGCHQLANMDGHTRAQMRQIVGQLLRTFDTVIIDTAAGIDDTSMGLAAMATDVVLVVNTEPLSLADAYAALKILYTRYGVRRAMLVPNCVESAAEADAALEQLKALVDRFLGIEVMALPAVPYDGYVSASCAAGVPVVIARPDAPASRAFHRVLRRIDALTSEVEDVVEPVAQEGRTPLEAGGLLE